MRSKDYFIEEAYNLFKYYLQSSFQLTDDEKTLIVIFFLDTVEKKVEDILNTDNKNI